jgi:hypothetical protein
MAETITLKTKGKASKKPKRHNPQEPKKGESSFLLWNEVISPIVPLMTPVCKL